MGRGCGEENGMDREETVLRNGSERGKEGI